MYNAAKISLVFFYHKKLELFEITEKEQEKPYPEKICVIYLHIYIYHNILKDLYPSRTVENLLKEFQSSKIS